MECDGIGNLMLIEYQIEKSSGAVHDTFSFVSLTWNYFQLVPAKRLLSCASAITQPSYKFFSSAARLAQHRVVVINTRVTFPEPGASWWCLRLLKSPVPRGKIPLFSILKTHFSKARSHRRDLAFFLFDLPLHTSLDDLQRAG